MGWLVVSILIFGLFVSMRLSIIAFDTWFSPLTHFLARWLMLVFLFQLNFLNYFPVSNLTWIVILGSIFSFSIGAYLPMAISKRKNKIPFDHIRNCLSVSICPFRLRHGIILLFFTGLILFAFYLHNMPGSPDLIGALSILSEVRSVMKEEKIFGFHFFYFMELVVYLCFLHILIWRKKTPLWIFAMSLLALLSLIYTTGKVNIAKAIVWCFFALLYMEVFRLRSTRIMKWLVILIVGGGIVFSLLVINERSDLASMGSGVYSNTGVAPLAYLYMSIPVGVLDKLLADPNQVPVYGAYMFGPILKVFSAMGIPMEIPSHIGEFYNTPIPGNIATYLDLMYKDFGLIGPGVIPFFIGLVCSYFFSKLRSANISLLVFSFNTILSLSVFGSTSAANYMKPSYWFQILVLLVLSRYVFRFRSGVVRGSAYNRIE